MNTRETTLGALTAADLGKRVRVLGEAGMLDHLDNHNPWGHPCVHIRIGASALHDLPPTTPVTVYDEGGDRG
jgi:hypothetical protein